MARKAGAAPRKQARAEIAGMFDALRYTIDRRLSELDRRITDLSVDINAAVQMVDFSEANLSGQLRRMHQQIVGAVAPAKASLPNSGIELEVVVGQSEAAAHRILGAAEAIRAAAARNRVDVAAIAKEVNVIFEACSFQDLTGQRIRRALERLQHIERVLAMMAKESAQEGDEAPDFGFDGALPEIDHDLGQDEIDKLLSTR
jgi:chemotaxis protein CheZ